MGVELHTHLLVNLVWKCAMGGIFACLDQTTGQFVSWFIGWSIYLPVAGCNSQWIRLVEAVSVVEAVSDNAASA